MEDLYTLYSPSHWSTRFSSSEEVIQYHLTFIRNASNHVISRIPAQVNIPYATSDRTRIDIFGLDLPEDAPIFIFVHGGYWQEESITRSSYHFMARNFYNHKIKTIFLGYDLCPEVTIPDIVNQVDHAARKCLAYARENGSKGIYLAGHSAGAHLVASLFPVLINTLSKEEQGVVKGAILISGVFDLAPLQKTAINDLLKLDERMAFELSPLNWTSFKNTSTPFYTIVGENESREFIKQSKDFSEKLEQFGVKSEFAVIENVDHFDIIERFGDEEYEVLRCIIESIE